MSKKKEYETPRFSIPKPMLARLKRLVKKYNSMTLTRLLEYVYSEYPESTTESEIKEYILGKH